MELCVPGLTKVLLSQQMQQSTQSSNAESLLKWHINFILLTLTLINTGSTTIIPESDIISILFILEDPDHHEKHGNDLM